MQKKKDSNKRVALFFCLMLYAVSQSKTSNSRPLRNPKRKKVWQRRPSPPCLKSRQIKKEGKRSLFWILWNFLSSFLKSIITYTLQDLSIHNTHKLDVDFFCSNSLFWPLRKKSIIKKNTSLLGELTSP